MESNNTHQTPEVATGNHTSLAAQVPRYGSKKDVAAMLQMSVRTVDNLVSRGCPALVISSRRLRFDMAEVRQWLADHYRVVRRAPAKGGGL
jgi:hypothetical protein